MPKPVNQPPSPPATPESTPRNADFRPASQLPKRRDEALALPPTGLRKEAWWHRSAGRKQNASAKKTDLPCFRAELHEPA